MASMRNNASKHAARVLSNKTLHKTPLPAPNAANAPLVKPAARRTHTRAGRVIHAHWSKLRDAVADETVRRDAELPAENAALFDLNKLDLNKQAVGAVSYVARRLRDSHLPWPRCYSSAFVSLPLAILLTGAMRGVLGNHTFLFFLAAVVVSATVGGLRAGLLTLLLSLLPCGYFLSMPVSVSPGPFNTAASLILFILMALVTCALSDSLYMTRQQAETAREQAENMARRFRFLAQASAMLESSRDYHLLLGQVTRAIVPAYADWTTIDLIDTAKMGAGDVAPSLTRVAASHPDADKEKLLLGLRERFPLTQGEDHPLADALRTGQPHLIADVGKTLQSRLWHDAEYAQAMRDIMPECALCVPLVTRGQTIGVLTFAATSKERRYTHTDLAMARDLGRRVAGAIENARLHQEAQREIAERTRMERQLEQQRQKLEDWNLRLQEQITRDGLTGLNNHMAFQEKMASDVERVRCDESLSLLLLDVDRFKQYNDTYGHPDGDRVLKQVAAALRDNARATDFVARYGGEEFVVILPDTDAKGAMQIGERLRQAIEEITGLSRQVTASFGAATLTVGPADANTKPHASTASELIALADKALYASKHEGRNRVTHAAALVSAAVENIASDALHTALRRGAGETLTLEAVVSSRVPHLALPQENNVVPSGVSGA